MGHLPWVMDLYVSLAFDKRYHLAAEYFISAYNLPFS